MPSKRKTTSRGSTSSAPPRPAWQTTWLWANFSKRARTARNVHASEIIGTVEAWMKKMDAVLHKGGTPPPDFTLHDEDHAFRVAARMEQLLSRSAQKNLSDYELALLLLAAYGHDIGMCPELGRVQAHHRYLFGHADGLTPAEQSAFQKFLDEYAAEPVPVPLSTSLAHLNLADELTAFYVRDRHNDWSAEWIRTHLTNGFGWLPDAISHLTDLCQSHHWGFHQLADRRFDPILSTGPQPQLVHRRYLACILRLADILENDPERTPDIIFRHRSIAQRDLGKSDPRRHSAVHWSKDHALSIDFGGDRFRLQARPRTAVAHRALEQLADWIDHELHGIAAFGEKLPPSYKVGRETIRREWHIAPSLIRDIQPLPGTYEYIDGAFRPNTSRLLQLLSNEQLYGKPIVAVRELLQNAFDAVREKVARRRLDPIIDNPADRVWEQKLGDQQKVTLTLRPSPAESGRWELVCEDTGVGLSRALITGHLLVSGQGRRHAILELERECQRRGFHPGLTGQFGIGVLSYFMLADQVTVETTRSQLCPDADGNWRFATSGVGSFGELTRLPAPVFQEGGTRLTMRLRADRIAHPAEFGEELKDYLTATLIRIPCRFELRVEGMPSEVNWQRSTGWVRTEEDLRQQATQTWQDPEDFFEEPERSRYANALDPEFTGRRYEQYAAALGLAKSTLRLASRDFDLPEHSGFRGHARMVMFWFETAKGPCFRPTLSRKWTFHPGAIDREGWKGIRCHFFDTRTEDMPGGLFPEFDFIATEIDTTSGDPSALAVSRAMLSLTWSCLEDWASILNENAQQLCDTVIDSPSAASLRLVNGACATKPVRPAEGLFWWMRPDAALACGITLPCALLDKKASHKPLRLCSTKQLVSLLSTNVELGTLPGWDGSLSFDHSGARLCQFAPGGGAPLELALVWDGADDSEFLRVPSSWTDLCWVKLPCCVDGAFLPANTLVALGAQEKDGVGSETKDAFFDRLDRCTTGYGACSALVEIARRFGGQHFRALWRNYEQSHPKHIAKLWALAAAAAGTPVSEMVLYTASRSLQVRFAPTGWKVARLQEGDAPLLPEVTDPHWLLELVEDDKVGG